MIHQYDHRWASYRVENRKPVGTNVTLAEKQDAGFTVIPRYWVDAAEVRQRLADRGWEQGSSRSLSQ